MIERIFSARGITLALVKGGVSLLLPQSTSSLGKRTDCHWRTHVSRGVITRFLHRLYTRLFPRREQVNEREKGGEVRRHVVTFSTAQNFRELFALLDAKGAVWGSQKCYTAAELKVLINRFRSRNPALHLPLQLIPRTAGLQQRVQELREAEILAEAAASHSANGHRPVE